MMNSIQYSIKMLSHSMDIRILNKLNAWCDFLQLHVGQLLDNTPNVIDTNNDRKIIESDYLHEIPKLHESPVSGADINIIHRFDESTMKMFGDVLIDLALKKIRQSDKLIQFQGEEVMSSWHSDIGIRLPNSISEFGEFAQGGYIMYMGPYAKQNAHQHGIRLGENEYFPDSGSRFLIGLIGAEKTSIRHVNGVFEPLRGSLITIHFKQEDPEPGAAHQFWNDGGQTGNLFLSIHIKDTIDSNKINLRNSANLMTLRTYEFENKILLTPHFNNFKIVE